MVNKMLSIPSEEILSISLSRSTSMPSEVSTLVGCHTNLSELIKSALVNEFDKKVDFQGPFQKCYLYPGRHLENKQ